MHPRPTFAGDRCASRCGNPQPLVLVLSISETNGTLHQQRRYANVGQGCIPAFLSKCNRDCGRDEIIGWIASSLSPRLQILSPSAKLTNRAIFGPNRTMSLRL